MNDMKTKTVGMATHRTGALSMIDLSWLACFLDCEGSLAVASLMSRRSLRPRYQARFIIVNSNQTMLLRGMELLETFNCYTANGKHASATSSRKAVRRITVQENKAVVRILSALLPYLYEKRDFATAMVSLFSRHEDGALWTEDERAEAESIRRKFMPRRKRAIGEAPGDVAEVTLSRSDDGTRKGESSAGAETTTVRANNNPSHENPASQCSNVLH